MSLSDVGFVENLSAAVEILGLEQAPTAFVLARTQWGSAEERDQFLREAAAALQLQGGQA